MSYLKNIITYFFHHPASDGVVERVHQRLADTNNGQEKEEVLSGIWEQIGFPQADEHQTLRAFEKLGTTDWRRFFKIGIFFFAFSYSPMELDCCFYHRPLITIVRFRLLIQRNSYH